MHRFEIGLIIAIWITACAADSTRKSDVCATGETQDCACTDGSQGAQECAEDEKG